MTLVICWHCLEEVKPGVESESRTDEMVVTEFVHHFEAEVAAESTQRYQEEPVVTVNDATIVPAPVTYGGDTVYAGQDQPSLPQDMLS